MAFFKFRWPDQKQQDGKAGKVARPAKAESIDAMRRRARHRLMGAAVLIVLGVVGFPMLFDTQPRPIPIDTPIEIPDRNKVAPLVVPADAPRTANAGAQPAGKGGTAVSNGLGEGEEIVAPRTSAVPKVPVPAFVPQTRPEPKAVAKVEPKPEPKPEPRPEPKPLPKPEPKVVAKPAPAEPPPKPEPAKPVKAAASSSSDEAARARALLEGRSAPPVVAAVAPAPRAAAPAQEGRFIVQVGAFADAAAAQEVQEKLQRAGFKTYTQVVNTKNGKRTRVRVGPVEGRAEADKAAARVKALGLAASIQTQ